MLTVSEFSGIDDLGRKGPRRRGRRRHHHGRGGGGWYGGPGYNYPVYDDTRAVTQTLVDKDGNIIAVIEGRVVQLSPGYSLKA
jgi:hypothetical protein